MRIAVAMCCLIMSLTSTASPRESSAAPAWPISPAPLRVLCTNADLIVVARVGAPSDEPDSRVTAGQIRWRAGLHIQQVLKGDPGWLVVNVSSVGTACPAPTFYREGDQVVAFLQRAESRWATSSLSYGLKPVDGDALGAYRERIAECLQLVRTPDEDLRRSLTVEWLLRCCEHPATCWEGAYELCRAGDSMSRYDRSPDPGFGRDLAPAQHLRLRESLEGRAELGRGELCLVELFTAAPEMREPAREWLLLLLMARLESIELDETDDSWSLDTVNASWRPRPLMEAAARLAEDPELSRRAEAYPGLPLFRPLELAREAEALKAPKLALADFIAVLSGLQAPEAPARRGD